MIGRLFVAVMACVVASAVACGGAPPPKKTVFPDPAQCVGGLCVIPQHTIARRVTTIDGKRCMIVAWDGDIEREDGSVTYAVLPPTAKVSTHDGVPARPGTFVSIELPALRSGVPFAISADARGSTTVLAARVNPTNVQFDDRRIASSGYVTVLASGDDLLVIVQTKWEGGREETAQFVVSKGNNGCGSPSP